MQNIRRPAPFVLLSSNHGMMVVNRNDYQMNDLVSGYGVGFQLMAASCFDQEEVNFAIGLLNARRNYHGDGVVAIDCGANIGVHTVEWARFMYQWGHVHSFEAQEKIYYALAGNVIINNCLNVTARHAAVGAQNGSLAIPEPNYLLPSSFGSLELKASETNEFIGQEIDYNSPIKTVPLVALDGLGLTRLDFIKIDVEGMEEDVLEGAQQSIARFMPTMIIEVVKSNRDAIERSLEVRGYKLFPLGPLNILAVHHTDPVLQHVALEDDTLWLR